MASPFQLIHRVQRLKKLRHQLDLAGRQNPYTELRAKPLGKFIPAISPDYGEPKHLELLLTALALLFGGSRRVCVSVPPRHGKSETLLHFIAWLLLREPKAKILYVTHTASFARKQSKTARRLARAAGVRLSDESNRADEWETESGGGLIARGLDGEITGRGFDIIIVDDPVKSRRVAESALLRSSMFEWFTNDVFTRLTPNGSVLVVHTRWHVDDLIGRLVKDKGYERINLRAIAVANDNGEPDNDTRAEGEALWPEGGWTAEVLRERREAVGEYAWWSLYQGEPRPRGGSVFGDAVYYDELPRTGYTVAFGIDLAYTAKGQGRGDYSVIVELWRSGDTYYVVDVVRKQVQAPEFGLTLKTKKSQRPGARMRWDYAGTEKGSAQFFARVGIHLDLHPAKGDPFVRAQEVAAAWNAGKVQVPNVEDFASAEHWLDAFVEELQDFTGLNDKHDDQVVALASGFESLRRVGGTGGSGGAYSSARKHRGSLPKPRD